MNPGVGTQEPWRVEAMALGGKVTHCMPFGGSSNSRASSAPLAPSRPLCLGLQ